MTVARFRFYEELNDFLPAERRKREFEAHCARAATVKNAIEALGVPHTEVELVLVNGRSVDFGYRMQDGDRISVYPTFEAFDIEPLLRVRPQPLRATRFIADSHLGGLARLLRMAGFDTRYDNDCADDEIRRRAGEEGRIILTRDRALLMCRSVTHGCYVHALEPRAQFREIVERLQLASQVRPFTLCLHCNLPLAAVGKAQIVDRLPPTVAATYERFCLCAGCRRVYWEGSHWERMRALLRGLLET
ncbi:MAG TPA: Mut7-C RNAse domain-containing protein [Casimicrobiaceae bacterium]